MKGDLITLVILDLVHDQRVGNLVVDSHLVDHWDQSHHLQLYLQLVLESQAHRMGFVSLLGQDLDV